jgi:hypothetical protein
MTKKPHTQVNVTAQESAPADTLPAVEDIEAQVIDAQPAPEPQPVIEAAAPVTQPAPTKPYEPPEPTHGRTGATVSGIPTVVGYLPPGAITTHADLVKAAGFNSAREFHVATSDPACPPLPWATRMFHQVVYDTERVRSWLREFAAFQSKVPELTAEQRHREAQERHQAAMRRLAEQDAAMERSRELQAMFRQVEAEGAERDRAEAAAHTGRQVFTTGGPL